MTKNNIKISMLDYINELLNQLCHNILLTNRPVFYQDGENISKKQ